MPCTGLSCWRAQASPRWLSGRVWDCVVRSLWVSCRMVICCWPSGAGYRLPSQLWEEAGVSCTYLEAVPACYLHRGEGSLHVPSGFVAMQHNYASSALLTCRAWALIWGEELKRGLLIPCRQGSSWRRGTVGSGGLQITWGVVEVQMELVEPRRSTNLARRLLKLHWLLTSAGYIKHWVWVTAVDEPLWSCFALF